VLENPFPGLRPFQEEEEHLFFGRESQVDRMVDKLAATRFLAVLGSSGSGKSSLVNCGLKPALHRGLMSRAGTSWRVVQFRPGSNPIRSMAQAFADEVKFPGAPDAEMAVGMLEATLKMSSLGVADLYEFARFEPGTNLLLVADQFEELFRFSRAQSGTADSAAANSEAVAFVNLLLEANAQQKYPIYVVLTMRSDFLGECSHFDRLPEVMNESQYLVPRLTRAERRAALSGPISVVGGQLSPVLLTRLVNDVGDDPAQLSIMQHAVNRTWAAWRKRTGGVGEIAPEDYAAVGTMANALDGHAEEAFAELETDAGKELCERIFKALTDRGTDSRGIRRPLPLKRLSAIAGASEAEVLPVLAIFRDPSRSFLMPPLAEQIGPETVIDISHEILMRVWERLKKWAEEEALSAAIYRRVAETAELHHQGKAALWRDPDLQMALEWQLQEKPTEDWALLYGKGFGEAIQFLAASKKVRDKERADAEFERRWKRATPYLVAAVLLFFLFINSKIVDSVSPHVATAYLKWNPVDIYDASLKAAGESNAHDLGNGVGYYLSLVLCFGIYAGLSFAGRWGYRRFAYARIAEECSVVRLSVVEVAASGAAAQLVSAGFWRRLKAGAVDLAVVLVALFLPFTALDKWATQSSWGAGLMLGSVLAMYLYRVLMTRGRWQGTLGERICGVMVTDRQGAQPTLARTSARFAAHFALLLLMAAITFIALLTVNVFAVLVPPLLLLGAHLPRVFTARKQALHDLVSGTVVVKRTPRS
jgi:uncharacterized RDD family membrane protein YckC/energy-coupling factor transporter ATP-binding protein EcfA2